MPEEIRPPRINLQWLRDLAKLDTLEAGARRAALQVMLGRARHQAAADRAAETAARGAEPPAGPPPPTAEGTGEPGRIAIRRPVRDYGWLQTLGSPANVMRRWGPDAAATMRAINLTEIKMMVELGQRTEANLNAIHRVPKAHLGRHGRVFLDLFDGKPIEEIEADPALTPEVKGLARYLRDKFEADRVYIRDRKREEALPHELRRAERDLRKQGYGLEEGQRRRSAEQLEALRERARELAEERILEKWPEDWGITTGYFPHIFPGDYKVYMTTPAGREFVASGRTPMEALEKIAELSLDAPAGTDFDVVHKVFVTPDMVRIGRARKFAVVNDIARAAGIDRDMVQDAMRGVIGARESREKWWGSLQHRTGQPGWERDLQFALAMYDTGFLKWRHVTDLHRQVMPAIQAINRRGQTVLADELASNLKILWGYRSGASEALDNDLQQIPVIRDLVKPFALERWTGATKAGIATLFLKVSPRFHVVNAMQPIQTLLPIVSAGEFMDGYRFYRGEVELEDGERIRGREVLERHGVRFLAAGKMTTEGAILPAPARARMRERLGPLAPETHNQEFAFATMYLKARRLGLDDAEAADYAFLRGNLYSQFVGLKTDQPRAIGRKLFGGKPSLEDPSGLPAPVKSTIFQFKRFMVKNLEIGGDLFADMLRGDDLFGFWKWLIAFPVIGGVRALLNPFLAFGLLGLISWETYRKLREEIGETAANLIFYGLPSLIGADLSYSMQPIDVPLAESLPEAIGEVALGPPGQLLLALGRAYADKKSLRSTPERMARTLAQRVPAFRPLEGLDRLTRKDEEGLYDFRTPGGRLKFKGDLHDVLMTMAGFRTLTVAERDAYTTFLVEILGQRSARLDEMAQVFGRARQSGQGLTPADDQAVDQLVARWNAQWPEFPISRGLAIRRTKERVQAEEVELLERMIRRAPKATRRGLREEVETVVPRP